MRAIRPSVLDELAAVVGAPHVRTDAADRAPHETDWTGRFVGHTPAVIRPGSAVEVAAVLDVCRREGIALVPQGGNTGLVGGGVPLDGEVVLSLRRLDAVEPVDEVARQVTAGAGATVGAVQRAAAAVGLRYAVDFGARDSATVGGSIATNAGGTAVLRFGSTRQQLVGIDAVLGTGHRVGSLEGLVKDNTGTHFPSLLCGSEGTLGIVTAARLHLVPAAAHHVVALLGFATVADAVGAVATIRSLDALEAAELVTGAGMALVCEAFGLPRPLSHDWSAYVLVEATAHHDPTDDLAAVVASAARVGEVAVAADAAGRAALWRYRDEQTLAIATVGTPHKLDVTVPAAAVAELVETVPRVVARREPGARTWLFGHVGDGNIHVNVTGLDPLDERVDDAVLRHVAALGGSVSAEHGIGRAKTRWIHLTRTADELAAMRALKQALDPAGVLNPAAVLPPDA